VICSPRVRVPASARETLVRLSVWSVRGIIAAGLVGLLDAALLAVFFPAAVSSAGGFALTIALLIALYSLFLIPIGCALSFLDVAAVHRRIPASPAWVAATVIAVPAIILMALAERFLLPVDLEFRREPTLILRLLQFAVVVAAGLVMPRWIRWVSSGLSRAPRFEKLLPPAGLGAFSLLALLVGHLACAPIHRVGYAALMTLVSGALMMVAMRAALPIHPRRMGPASVAALLVCATISLYLPGPTRAHARFVTFVRGAASAALLPWLRDIVDRDGDGSAPEWAGGTDCREGDPSVGPALREVPGDGIDQDCRGGDAPAPSAPAPRASGPEGCRPHADRMSIVLIVIDALRGDFVSAQTTPSLWTLAGSSSFFTRAYSPTNATVSSFPSLFSSRPLSDMGASNPVMDDSFRVDATLTERLQRAGFETVAMGYLEYHPFVQRGFEERNPQWIDSSVPNVKHDLTTVALARGLLDVLTGADRPVFALLHLSDVHAPYVLGGTDSDNATGERAAYLRGVEYTDFHLGQLFARMQRLGLLDRTIIAITADHGEELFQRGRHGHASSVFEEGVHVPLILWIPGCPGRRIDHPVSTVRLGPTLGAIEGVDVPGRGLFSPTDLPVVTEGASTTTDHFQRAIYDGHHKLVVDVANGGRMLFDLTVDPGETHNVCIADQQKCEELEGVYQRWLDAPAPR
jgi:Sulfatase